MVSHLLGAEVGDVVGERVGAFVQPVQVKRQFASQWGWLSQ